MPPIARTARHPTSTRAGLKSPICAPSNLQSPGTLREIPGHRHRANHCRDTRHKSPRAPTASPGDVDGLQYGYRPPRSGRAQGASMRKKLEMKEGWITNDNVHVRIQGVSSACLSCWPVMSGASKQILLAVDAVKKSIPTSCSPARNNWPNVPIGWFSC